MSYTTSMNMMGVFIRILRFDSVQIYVKIRRCHSSDSSVSIVLRRSVSLVQSRWRQSAFGLLHGRLLPNAQRVEQRVDEIVIMINSFLRLLQLLDDLVFMSPDREFRLSDTIPDGWILIQPVDFILLCSSVGPSASRTSSHPLILIYDYMLL